MLDGILELLLAQHVDVGVVQAVAVARVQDADQVGDSLILVATQAVGGDRVGQRDAVQRVVVVDLADREHRRQHAVGIHAVLRVRARGVRGALGVAGREGTGVLAVLDVRGDRQDGLGRDGAAVDRQALDLAHDRGDDPLGDVVGAIVVVAVDRELALGAVADHQIVIGALDILVLVAGHVLGVLVVDRVDLGVLDGGQRVGGDGQTGHAATQGAVHLLVVQGHLDGLVGVLIMHVVDDVQRHHVGLGQPLEGLLVVVLDLLVIQRAIGLGLDRIDHALVDDLHAGHLVTAAVDRVQQGLGGVHAGGEELHLLADAHRGHAAGDGRVVAPVATDLLVGLILDGRGVDGDLGAETLVALRQLRIPEDRDVRLRAGSQVLKGQRVEQTERGLGDHGAAVVAEAGVGPGRPVRVAGEDGVIVLGTQEADDAQLHDDVVDELLGTGLVQRAVLQVTLDVDVEEGRVAAEGHGGAVLALDRGQVAHVGPLHGFLCGLGRAGQIQAVLVAEVDQLLQGLDLLVVLFAETDPVLDLRLGEVVAVRHGVLIALLELDQGVHAVQGHAAVVADDAATAVGVRQTGEDLVVAGDLDLLGVHAEDAIIVGLAVLGEDLLDLRIRLLAGLLDGLLDHAPAAVRHHRTLAGNVGLQADDHVVHLRAVDVAGRESINVGRGVGIHVVDALLALHGQVVVVEILPQMLGLFGRTGKEGLIALVRRVVLLNEVTHVDIVLPMAAFEAVPRLGVELLRGDRGCINCCHIHSFWVIVGDASLRRRWFLIVAAAA